MCNFYELLSSKDKMEELFNSEMDFTFRYSPTEEYNGFQHPFAPIILNTSPEKIIPGQWGLLPDYVTKDIDGYRKDLHLLNARIETAEVLREFKKSSDKRCLVLATAFFEWKHFDNHKIKIKHRISVPGEEVFTMAGIYQKISYLDAEWYTFSILTTEANTLMADIHNTKKRMPVVLLPEEQKRWLSGDKMESFHQRQEIELKAEPLSELPLLLFS